MTGLSSQKSTRTAKAPASGFSNSNGTSLRMNGYSLSKTEPTKGIHSGPFWNGSNEVSQNSLPDTMSSHGDFHTGFSDSFNAFHVSQESHSGVPVQENIRTSYSSASQSLWENEMSATHIESQAMIRFPSQDSVGAESHSSTNSYDQSRSGRTFSHKSQMPIGVSYASSDAARSNSPDSSAFCTPTQMEFQAFEPYQYQRDQFLSMQPNFHRNSLVSNSSQPMSSTSGPSYNIFATSGEDSLSSIGDAALLSHGPALRDSVIYNPSMITDVSSTMWDEELLDSHRSSPLLDEWIAPQLIHSPTNSPIEYSPSLEGLSPRYVEGCLDLVDLPPHTTGDRVNRKPIGPRLSKATSDMAAASRRPRLPGSEASDEALKVVGRSSLELDNTAREDPLYHNASPQADGLYHCPWEKKPGSLCQHKPEKLKCNYDKFVDSHLKPYRCKVLACKDLHFSSTACLLRHEREAHAMHGHGDKPYLCKYEGCERGVPGNGFPRQWNLRDHMKRVHNDPGQPLSNSGNSPPPSAPAKSKKRKASEVQDSALPVPKRVNTPPVAAPQPREPTLLERYQEQKSMLLKTVESLQDPTHPNNMDLLRSAKDSITVLAKISANHKVNKPSD